MSAEAARILIGLLVSVTGIVVATKYIKLNAFFSLLLAAVVFGLIAGIPFAEILPAIQSGFGSLLQQIGIIVALGSVLGMLLEKTGAMQVLSSGLLQLFGARRSVFAMALIGIIVGVPVFCDSGFIILSRLIPSLAIKTSVAPASLTLALSSGLYTTHTLVPPTPGPLAAASNLGVGDSLGLVMLIGLVGSFPVLIVSYIFSRAMGVKIPSAGLHYTDVVTGRNISLFAALLPLVTPIILIALASFIKIFSLPESLAHFFEIIGSPMVALFIGVLFALALLKKSDKDWPQWIGEALKDAGVILLITGAGGSFGAVIKSSGVDKVLAQISSTVELNRVMLFCFAWVLGAILKTAQGSTTSSMIITSSLVAPLLSMAGMVSPIDLSLLVLSVGGGAMCVSHANDSYFWVVSQFGGIAPQDAFRSFTLLTFLQGFTVLVTAILLSFVL
jgi:GntP family gluconate:H+ symporter